MMASVASPEPRRKPRKQDEELDIDAIYHSLSRINGDINKMNRMHLRQQLNRVGLNEKGVNEVLRKRLKNYYKKQKLRRPHVDMLGDQQYFPYLIVVDFEATCEEKPPRSYLHEIIEFPAILIDTSSKTIVDEFHMYCKPTLNPELSSFCSELTGITQSQVNNAKLFSEVFEEFETWLEKHKLFMTRTCAFVTDGPWDFSRFLNIQCCLSEIKYPKWAKHWVNLKKVYGNFYKLKKPRLMDMLSNIGLTFEGHLHCGLDDARNLSRVVIRLMQDGAKFQLNERLRAGKLENIPEDERILLHDVTDDSSKNELENTSDKLEKLSLSDHAAQEIH